jgi:hypothetical protein
MSTIISKPSAKLRLQFLLSLQGFSPGQLDGIIGPKTEAALQAFQQARNLPSCPAAFSLADPHTGPALQSFPQNPGAEAALYGLTYLGLTESPPNSNNTLFGNWFGENGVPWCNIFLSYCFQMSRGIELCKDFHGTGTKPGKGCAYVATTLAWLQAKNLIMETANMLPGDLVIHSWTEARKPEHISLCCGTPNSSLFPSIEGNTSSSSDSNGGQVLLRQRNTSHVIAVGRIPAPLSHEQQ